ncbi:TPA: hypothetical protein OPJ97_000792 [Shigella sonnei]|nr:hypothetical protein [Shigella sonnei]EHB2585525.1 hypothetical protein [Shigella sonnei]EJF9332859.1 hypothetical protein [Shigella sonnei]EJF9341520.1 hypothetical protein [Shigella sonnei]EJF9349956.1 hypothetical protein [Shigella sonnei]
MGMMQECLVLIEGYDPYVVNVSRMNTGYSDYKTGRELPFTIIRMNGFGDDDAVYCCIASDKNMEDRTDEARILLRKYKVKPLSENNAERG